MPKCGIHYYALQQAINKLNSGNQNERNISRMLRNNSSNANLGAIGPDIFFWAPDYELADKLYTLMKNIDGIVAIYNTVVGPVREVKNAVGEVTEEVVGSLAPSTVEMIKTLVNEIKETSELFKSSIRTSLLSGVLGIADTLANIDEVPSLTHELFTTFAPEMQHQLMDGRAPDESEWYWFDFLHYRRTGLFAHQLINNAKAGNAVQQAFAYGYLSHIGTDVTGHPFVNQLVGGPYRLNVQKHCLVENYMDVWAFKRFYNQDISKTLLSKLELPNPSNLSESIIDLLDNTLRSTFSDLHPNRLRNPGFLTKQEIHQTYETFYRVLQFSSSAVISKPEEPFSGVLDILSDALNDLMEPPPSVPEYSDMGTCSAGDILSFGLSESSRDCYENFFKEAGRYLEYVGELIYYLFETLLDIIDLIIAALLSLPITVLLALLYGIQLLCYEIYKSSMQVLAEQGFIYPDPELLNTSIGRMATTTSASCSVPFKYPFFKEADFSHLICPRSPLENPATAADFNASSIEITPEKFIKQTPFNIANLNQYINANSPEETRDVERLNRQIGNAVDFSKHLISVAGQTNLSERDITMLQTDWNLDSDRGYGYKNWTGKIQYIGKIPKIEPENYL